MDEYALPSLLGDFARIMRSHGIATVFHAGQIDPIEGISAEQSLQAAIVQFGDREGLTAECQSRIFEEVSTSLFDASAGVGAAKKMRRVAGRTLEPIVREPLNYVPHAHNVLRAKIEHAVEDIARLACEVDDASLRSLTESLNDSAKSLQGAVVSQWGQLSAPEYAALLRMHPKTL